MKKFLKNLTLIVFVFCFFILPKFSHAEGASLSLSPKTGTFYVGSTFDVSIMLDTNEQNVNALQLELNFPADKLQVVEPFQGKSIIKVWTAPPSYSNIDGKVILQGGIPNPGIKTSSGLVFTISFRAKVPGEASLNFGNKTKVLRNDGQGTNILGYSFGAQYNIEVPPPEGPIVYSTTHPNQSKWYKNKDTTLLWKEDGASAYSYILAADPGTAPNNISEGNKNYVYYEKIKDGIWYFNVKAKKGDKWGGISTFVLKIDSEAPAGFKIQTDSSRTTNHQPVISFFTTDGSSGVDHYEVKIIDVGEVGSKKIYSFTEQVSPYQLPNLENGTYDVIVRAFDKAGNWKDETLRMEILPPWISFLKAGIAIRGFLIPWWIIILILLLVLGFIIFLVWKHKKEEKHSVNKVKTNLSSMKEMIDNEIKSLDERVSKDIAIREKIKKQIGALEMIDQVGSKTYPPAKKVKVIKKV
jgi:hypothetical protein